MPWQKTIAAIRAFQRAQVGLQHPDGRVDPNGPTLAKLNEFERAVAERLPPGRLALV